MELTQALAGMLGKHDDGSADAALFRCRMPEAAKGFAPWQRSHRAGRSSGLADAPSVRRYQFTVSSLLPMQSRHTP